MFYNDYQLLFFTPGRNPWLANSRKQIRHMSKSLIYALFLPHLKQRRTDLVENFGFLFNFAICAFVAMKLLTVY